MARVDSYLGRYILLVAALSYKEAIPACYSPIVVPPVNFHALLPNQ